MTIETIEYIQSEKCAHLEELVILSGTSIVRNAVDRGFGEPNMVGVLEEPGLVMRWELSDNGFFEIHVSGRDGHSSYTLYTKHLFVENSLPKIRFWVPKLVSPYMPLKNK